MSKRIALAAVLGGLTLFAWGAISHVVLSLGDAGMAPVQEQDQALLDAIQQTTPEAGIYMFPGMAEEDQGDSAAMEAWAERTKTEPHGLLVVNHDAYTGMGPQLGTEFGLDVLMALAAALVLCRLASASYLARVGLVTSLGVFVALRPLQHWNWFHFPCTYTCAQVLDGFLGFLALGLVLAAIVKPGGATRT